MGPYQAVLSPWYRFDFDLFLFNIVFVEFDFDIFRYSDRKSMLIATCTEAFIWKEKLSDFCPLRYLYWKFFVCCFDVLTAEMYYSSALYRMHFLKLHHLCGYGIRQCNEISDFEYIEKKFMLADFHNIFCCFVWWTLLCGNANFIWLFIYRKSFILLHAFMNIVIWLYDHIWRPCVWEMQTPLFVRWDHRSFNGFAVHANHIKDHHTRNT